MKKKLEIGDKVWLESSEMLYLFGKTERKIEEYVIVDSNKSSAYAVKVANETKYKSDPKEHSHLKVRIIHRNHEVKSSFLDSYRLWYSKEDFELDVKNQKEDAKLKKYVESLVGELTIKELKEIKEKYGSKKN